MYAIFEKLDIKYPQMSLHPVKINQLTRSATGRMRNIVKWRKAGLNSEFSFF